MASIGLFDLSGHAFMEPTFQLGSPLFDEVIIKLDKNYYSGKELIIKTINNSKENIYIQDVTFNGKILDKFWIERNRVMKGGELVIEMGNRPAIDYRKDIAPPSMSLNENL